MRLTDGKLLIEARSTAWATQLRLMSDDLKRRIGAEGLELKEIEVVGPRSPSWRRGGGPSKEGVVHATPTADPSCVGSLIRGLLSSPQQKPNFGWLSSKYRIGLTPCREKGLFSRPKPDFRTG